MNLGLIGAVGGLGQGVAQVGQQEMNDRSEAERQARIQEYAMARMDRQADIDAESARVGQGYAMDRLNRQSALTADRDAKLHAYGMADKATDQYYAQQTEDRARKRAEEERARRAGLVSGAMGENGKFDYKKAADLLTQAGDVELAKAVREAGPSDYPRLAEAVKEYIDTIQIQMEHEAGKTVYGEDQQAGQAAKIRALRAEIGQLLGMERGAAPSPKGGTQQAYTRAQVQSMIEAWEAAGDKAAADKLRAYMETLPE